MFRNVPILVTGAYGFIGRHVCRKLYSEGARLTLIDNLSNSSVEDWEKEEEWIKKSPAILYDLWRPLPILKSGDFEYIIHLGSPCSVVQFNKDPNGALFNTVNSFRNILHLAMFTEARLIYPSSGSVYGDAPLPNFEEDEPRPTNLYGLAKFLCEKMALEYYNENHVESIGLRIFAGYGPGEEKKGETASVISLFLGDLLEGKSPIIYGDGTQSRDFVYIDTIVEAILGSLDIEYSYFNSIINVGTGEAFTFNDVVEILRKELGSDIHPTYINKPSIYVERTLADTSRMYDLLGITPIPFIDGIRKTIAYRKGIYK